MCVFHSLDEYFFRLVVVFGLKTFLADLNLSYSFRVRAISDCSTDWRFVFVSVNNSSVVTF